MTNSEGRPRVMIVGLGSLGGVLLELLAREEAIGEILVASRNRARAETRCNLARVGALAQGCAPNISFVALDLHDRARTAGTIAECAPDLVVSTASLQTWWLAELLPPEARAPLARVPFGAWLPVHLALAIRLMEALRDANFHGHSLVASFPDAVNVVLGRLGLAPTCGLGNLDEIVPKLRYLAAARLKVSPGAVRVLLVAHHALEPFVFSGREPERPTPPRWMRIDIDGEDVTERVGAARLLFEPYPLPAGPAWHFLTAGSAVRLIRALLADGEQLLHVPAPDGLPGGYPVIATPAGVRRVDLPGLSPADAVSINEQSQPFDGIDRIDRDGTTRFTAAASAALEEVLGYNGGLLRPSECEARAEDLMARFRSYARRHGVDLEAAEAASRVMI